MILRVRTFLNEGGDNGCEPTLSFCDAGTVNYKIEHKGNILLDQVCSQLGEVASGYLIDNNGCSIPYSIDFIPNDITHDGVLKINIAFKNVWDYVDLKITSSHVTELLTYTNTFKIYGYDLGINGTMLATSNSLFDIVLSHTATVPYFIAYRKPFTNQIDVYNACSFQDTSNIYEVDSDAISYLNNFSFCSEPAVTLTRYNSICNYSQTIRFYRWIPLWETRRTCTECITEDCVCECANIYDSQGVLLNIDFDTIGFTLSDGSFNIGMYVDDVLVYPFKSLGIGYTVYDSNAVERSSQHSAVNLPLVAIPIGSQAITYSIAIPEVGAYQVNVCLDILGIPEYITNGDLDLNSYYYINNSSESGYDDSDFSIVNVDQDNSLFSLFTPISNSLTPDWDEYGNTMLVQTADTGILTKGYHMIVALISTGGTDAIGQDLCTPIFTNVTNSAVAEVGYCWYGNEEPQNWCGSIVVDVTPVISCCKSILIEGCLSYEVTQGTCDTRTVTNYGDNHLECLIKQFNGSAFVELTDYPSILIEPFDTVAIPTTISFPEDGIYTLTIDSVEDEDTRTTVIIVDCEMNACKLDYLKKLICCNVETNCSSCCDDCSKKEYYDFNAFNIIMQEYFTIANYIKSFGYYYTPETITALETDIATVYSLLEQAKRYCMTCEEPCKEC